jgi:hypothetical protein
LVQLVEPLSFAKEFMGQATQVLLLPAPIAAEKVPAGHLVQFVPASKEESACFKIELNVVRAHKKGKVRVCIWRTSTGFISSSSSMTLKLQITVAVMSDVEHGVFALATSSTCYIGSRNGNTPHKLAVDQRPCNQGAHLL